MALSKRTFQSAGQISQHLIPGAYSRIDSVKGIGGLVSANNLVIMGQSTGGKPATLLQFNGIAEAANALRGGPLMEAVRLAFNPGNDLVPQRIYAVRVNDATQSTYTMQDGSANDMIKVDSRDYGLSRNQVTLTLETGTNFGKKITVKYKTDQEVFDDVRRQSFTVQYTDGAATMTITNNSGTQELTTSVGLSVDLNNFPTVGDLVAYINNQADYTASVVAGQEGASSLELDSVSSQDINSSAYTAESTMQAIIDVLNNESGYVEASAVNAANDRAIPENFTETYMTGGSEGDYTSTEWSDALTMLEGEDIQFVSTPDDDAAVHAAIATHCATMSSVTGRKERQFIVGGAWGDSVDTAISNSQTLNSKSGMFVFNGFTQRDANGVVQNYSAGYAACLLAGMAAAQALNETQTFKTLNVISLEDKLTNSELEQLIKNGVCPLNYNSQRLPHVVRAVNTYQTDDIKWNEFSSVKEMYFISRDLRAYLEDRFVGRPGTKFYGGVMKGAVETKLAQYTDLGLFTQDANGTAWWNVQLSIAGDTVTVDYDAYITLPINFIFITNHFHEIVSAA